MSQNEKPGIGNWMARLSRGIAGRVEQGNREDVISADNTVKVFGRNFDLFIERHVDEIELCALDFQPYEGKIENRAQIKAILREQPLLTAPYIRLSTRFYDKIHRFVEGDSSGVSKERTEAPTKGLKERFEKNPKAFVNIEYTQFDLPTPIGQKAAVLVKLFIDPVNGNPIAGVWEARRWGVGYDIAGNAQVARSRALRSVGGAPISVLSRR